MDDGNAVVCTREVNGSIQQIETATGPGYVHKVNDSIVRVKSAEPRTPTPKAAPLAVYDYCDENGTLLFQVLRYPGKEFRQRRPNGKGGWINNLEGVVRPFPPYRLKDILEADPAELVVYVEGEKDADNANNQLGVIATTNPGGAGKLNVDLTPLKGRRVVVIADKDEPGRRHAKLVAEALIGIAASVKGIELPGENVKDLSGWLEESDWQEPAELRQWLFALVDEAEERVNGGKKITRSSGLEVIPFSAIAPEILQWLWPERIPLGKIVLIIGDPGLGKSTITIWLIAQVTSGGEWPDRPGEFAIKGDALLLSAEDDPGDTIRPRLDAAGAEVDRVHLIKSAILDDGKSGHFNLGRDIERLEAALKRLPNVRLLVIDPISSYLGAVDDHRNSELRGLLAPLADLVARYKLAVVGVSHLRKSPGKAVHAALGSMAYTATARAVHLVAEDPDDKDRRLFLPVKGNLSAERSGLRFEINRESGVIWLPGSVDVSADQALSPERDPAPQKAEAIEFLQEILAGGAVSAKEVFEEAELRGIGRRTLERAKKELGIRSQRGGFGSGGTWEWALPAEGIDDEQEEEE